MWREKMEPLIITKCVSYVAERGLFSVSFHESFMNWDSPLMVVNGYQNIYSNHVKSCHPQHCGFQKGEKKE